VTTGGFREKREQAKDSKKASHRTAVGCPGVFKGTISHTRPRVQPIERENEKVDAISGTFISLLRELTKKPRLRGGESKISNEDRGIILPMERTAPDASGRTQAKTSRGQVPGNMESYTAPSE